MPLLPFFRLRSASPRRAGASVCVVCSPRSPSVWAKPNFMYGHELDLSRFIGSLLFLPTLSGTKLLPVVIQGWTPVFEMIFYALFTIALFFRQQYRIYLLAAALIGMASCHLLATEPHVAAIIARVSGRCGAGNGLAKGCHRRRHRPRFSVCWSYGPCAHGVP